jgi:hypothetical protein
MSHLRKQMNEAVTLHDICKLHHLVVQTNDKNLLIVWNQKYQRIKETYN